MKGKKENISNEIKKHTHIDVCQKQCHNFSEELQFKFTHAHTQQICSKNVGERDRNRDQRFLCSLCFVELFIVACMLRSLFIKLNVMHLVCDAGAGVFLCCNNTLIAPYYVCVNHCVSMTLRWIRESSLVHFIIDFCLPLLCMCVCGCVCEPIFTPTIGNLLAVTRV